MIDEALDQSFIEFSRIGCKFLCGEVAMLINPPEWRMGSPGPLLAPLGVEPLVPFLLVSTRGALQELHVMNGAFESSRLECIDAPGAVKSID